MKSIKVKLFGSDSKVEISPNMILCLPSHGPCKITSIEEKEILGEKMIICTFEDEMQKTKISIPVEGLEKAGVRSISNTQEIEKMLKNLFKRHTSISKGVWTRRIQEYELRYNSGNLLRIAEIIKDLYAGVKRFDKSYSERILFNKAFDFFVAEYAVAYGITMEEANSRITDVFDKNLTKDVYKESLKENDNNDDECDFDDNDEEYNDDDEEEDEKIA